ncbi:MAG: hypothetical protein HIU86_11390 [Acidobacteria bacterium]|nr:hypothetical protein [Acidobacteriota bacterium]
MRHTSWHDLDPRLRQVLLTAAGVEAGLKIAALIDLAQRSRAEVVGTRTRWAVAILLLNTVGVLPIAYFLRGRR